jgi:hypothetical protein
MPSKEHLLYHALHVFRLAGDFSHYLQRRNVSVMKIQEQSQLRVTKTVAYILFSASSELLTQPKIFQKIRLSEKTGADQILSAFFSLGAPASRRLTDANTGNFRINQRAAAA